MKKIVWVTRSFLDYRVPVFQELSRVFRDDFYLIFSKEYVPERVIDKARWSLKERAIGLGGELKIGKEDNDGMANSGFNLRLNPRVLKHLYKLNPDLIICDGFFKWTFLAVLYKIVFRKKLVVCYERTEHTERNVQRIRTVYRKLILKFVDAISCNGRLSREYLVSLGYPEDRITEGQMVADVEGISEAVSQLQECALNDFKDKFQLPEFVYLYVGSLTERKGVVELLNAWEKTFKNNSRVALVLVGDGDKRQLLEQMKSKSNSDIRLLGKLNYDELAIVYGSSDIFIIGTLEDNWSLVVPEAMSASLPIVSSKYNGCWPELVHEQINGWVFDPCDINSYERVLLESFESRTKFLEMGRESKKIVDSQTSTTAAEAIAKACDIAMRQ